MAWSVVLAYAALQTPNSWKRPPAGLEAAKRLASDREAIKIATENATGYPVDPVMPALVQATDSYITKEGFSFHLLRHPGILWVRSSFDVGPQAGIDFDVVESGGRWELRRRFVPSNALTLRAPALRRKFPQARAIEAGGNGPYLPRDVLPVRIARGETDWDIVLLRIADGGEPLREIRRYSRDELMRRFSDLLNKEGIGPLESAVIYFRPVRDQDVAFIDRSEFPFIGVLGNARYWRAEIVARLSGEDLQFAITRRLTRPQN